MILIDKMKNLKIYRQSTFLPTGLKDKKKRAAVLLFTPSFESSKKLMTNHLFINKKRYESYYLERDIAFYIGQKKVEDIDDESIEESVYIEETKRSELPDSAFGVPSKRKFPLDTEAHVRSAIKFFNYVDPEDEAELARRIIAAMRKFHITDVKVGEKNRFSKYYHPKKATNEAANISNLRFIKSDDGAINACVDIEGYEHSFRARSSMLILRKDDNGWRVFLKYDENEDEYHAPGGGWNENESAKDAAVREAQEEANINVKDVSFEGTRLEYYEEVREWVKDHVANEEDWWYGYYSEIFVGLYDSDFKGKVESLDKDEYIKSGNWYLVSAVRDQIGIEYAAAIDNYIARLNNSVEEGYVISEEDILHNKDKFDSGEINLCFITGLSGSGKTTLANREEKAGAEKYELDDLLTNYNFSDENLKEYGNLISNFFKGIGRKYRLTDKEEILDDKFEEGVIRDFVKYAMTYAESHKDKKFVLEGVELYWFFKPEELKDYAVYIKGTSTLLSMIRSAKRDSADADGALKRMGAFLRNMFRKDRAHAYMETEKIIKKWRSYYKESVTTEDVDIIDEKDIRKCLTENDEYLDLGDKLMFFGEAADRTNEQLKKLLFRSRIKNRKELLLKLEEVKEQLSFIKYAFPELKRLAGRNVFVDLYYYNAIFFQNNTWVQQRGLNLYLKFMEKLFNHPNLKDAGYDKKTIFIPVLDWVAPKDNAFWNYRVKVTPISCIYQLMFEGRLAALRKVFGDTDVVFVGNDNTYFKINFSTLEDANYKRDAITFRTLLRKMIFSEEFDLDEIDTAAEKTDSPEVIRNKIIDKIEQSKGVDLSADVQKAVERHNKQTTAINKQIDGKKLNKEDEKTLADTKVKHIPGVPTSVGNVNATKQDPETKKEVVKQKEEKKAAIKNSTKISTTKAQEEEDIDFSSDDASQEEDIEKLADYIVRASEYNDNEEEAEEELDDDEIKRILASLSSNDNKVNISPTRAARMTKMNQDLLNKEVNGKSIQDILNDDSNKEENVSNYNIASPNQDEWKDMTFVNFDKNYNIDKDIINIFRHFADCSHPLAIRNIKVTDSSTAYDRTHLYDVDLEDYRGARYNIKLDIPIMEDNRFLLRGNSKSIQAQFFNAPIIKTDTDTCQLISNYMKVFLYRFGAVTGKSSPIAGRIIKAYKKYQGRKLKFTTGDNFKVSNKYALPIDYIDLSSMFTYIETPDMVIYFNQDEIRKKYVIEPDKGIPFAFHKKENAVIYFKMNSGTPQFTFDKLLIDILKNADQNFFEIFESVSAPKSCNFVRASIMNSKIPVALICGYYVGLQETLKRAGITYKIEPKLTKEIRQDYNLDWIRFDDGYIVYEQSYSANILLNGLKVCPTDLFSVTDIDNQNMYLEFLDDFGGRIKADGLDNFRDLFVDPMIEETLKFYKLPTDFVDILLYGTSLQADNKFIKHTDTSSRRLRRYQLIAVYTYKVLAEAYGMYANKLRHSSNNAIFSVKRSAVIDAFLADVISSDDSCINALRDVETTNAVSTKGPSGMNSARAYSLDKRSYDESMINILGMSTGFAGNVGITRQTTIQANVTPEGYVIQTDDTSEMNDANSLTATEALIPMSSTHDDPMRVAMSFIQTSKHEVRTEDSDPLLVTNGADEVMAYLTTNRFAYKAKGKGKIVEITEDYIIVQYADGTNDFINLKETIEHNSDGGYYVPLKLDAVKGLKVGMSVDKDQILAYDKYSFSNNLGESDNIAYNVGKIAKVAVVNSDEGFEDSGVISASMAKKLATRINAGYDAIINMDATVFKIAKVGDHIEASDSLIIWEDAFDDQDSNDILASLSDENSDFSELGKRKVKSEVTGILRDIKIYRTCELEDMSPSVRKIVTEYERPIKETLKVAEKYGISKSKIPAAYSLAPNGKLKKAQKAIYIEFYVEYLDTVGVGDKVVYNAANKAVEKSIFPEGLEPYTAFRPNEIIDAFVSEVSIDKRLVTSSIVSGALNKLMVELDRSVKDIMGIPYDDTTV